MPHPPRRRLVARHALLTVLSLVLAACSQPSTGSPGPTSSSSADLPASPSPSFAPTPLRAPSKRCAFPKAPAKVFWFRAADGTMLDGAVLGSGSTGIVLAHEYPADLCGWWPYAVTLSRQGFRVLLFDFRCAGVAECPKGGLERIAMDTPAAVARFRATGVDHVFLVGASLGAVVSLVTGGTIRPALDGVVSLSGESDLTARVGAPLDARGSVPGLLVPVLFMVARDDPAVTPAATRAMYRHAGSTDKRLVVLPGFFGHGWLMLSDAGGTATRASAILVDWIRAHAS